MARRPWEPVLEHIRALAAARPDARACDAELLSRFVGRRDEAAFESLLRRHGPMVLRVARRVLDNDADAEDVFQATFLLLARRASTIRKRESVASWLHSVAYRLAVSMRSKRRKRQATEKRAAEARPTETPSASAWSELEGTLHEALAQLPAKYRTPLVYCYLEGWTQEEVARDLGVPLGTLRSWVARGRELLRKRLLRRGIAFSATGASSALLASACATAEAVPISLRIATLQAVRLFDVGGNAMTLVSPQVAMLVRRGMTTLLVAKLKGGAACFLVLALLVAGSGWAAHRTFGAKPPERNETAGKAPPKQAASAERPRVDVHGDPLPPGAIARLGTVRFRHEDGIFQLAVSPDGRTLAAAAGKSVALWDSQTGRLTGRVAFTHDMHCVAFTPDGKSVAVGTRDCIVRLVDPASGKELRRFAGHRALLFQEAFRNSIHGVAFSADGQRLVTWGSDETARLWDVRSGKELRTLDVKGWRTEQGGRYYLYFDVATNGKLVASSTQGSPKTLLVRDAKTGKVVHQLVHPADVGQAVFSPDGKTLAVPRGTWGQPGWIALWDLSSGKELGTLTGHKNTVSALAFSPDGKKLASCSSRDATIRLWDLDSRKELRQALSLPSVQYHLAFSPDGKTLFSSGANQVRLWDVAAWRERQVAQGPNALIGAFAFSPDGRRAASASGKTIWLWNMATGERIRSLEGHETDVRGLAFSTDGTALISTSESHVHHRSPMKDRTIRIWDLKTGQEQRRIPNTENQINLIAFAPDRATFAVWSYDKDDRVLVRNIRTDAKPRSFALPPDDDGDTTLDALCFSPDGKILYASRYLHILRWDAATGKALPPLGKHDGGNAKIALSPDGRSLAALTTYDGTLYLWEIASKQTRLVVKSTGFADSVAFSPDGRLLALANTGYHYDQDGTPVGIENREQVRLVRIADGKVIHRFTGHIGGINGVSFSPDGRTLASSGQDTTVLLWDLTDRAVPRANEAPPLKPERLAELWKGLRGTAAESHRCMSMLIAAPAQAVPFLSEKLKPVVEVDAERFAQLLKKLESDQFREREDATRELKKLGDSAEPALRNFLKENLSLETRRRLQALLDELSEGERLRCLRAIEVVERIGDKQARDLLRRLSEGAAEAWLTEEARATLQRLERRAGSR
ncbi:MAG TPA: sigma-70 family RNA polymerase sigma factor [Gemmataceae bacterium]